MGELGRYAFVSGFGVLLSVSSYGLLARLEQTLKSIKDVGPLSGLSLTAHGRLDCCCKIPSTGLHSIKACGEAIIWLSMLEAMAPVPLQ